MSNEVVPDKPPSLSVGAQPPLDAGTIHVNDARVDVGDKKGKEKVEEKRKELVFFKGVLLVDLDDYDVSNNRLHCDSDDLDDDDIPKLEGMDISDGNASSLQCLEPNTGLIVEPLQSLVRVHSDRLLRQLLMIMTYFSMRQERSLIQMLSL